MIPKVIFFYWDNDTLHPLLQENIDYVKQQNPEYEVKIITPKIFIELIEEKYIKYYNRLNKNFSNLGANYARYLLLYLYGGVYLDIKSRPAKPLNDFINDNVDCWILREYPSLPNICNSMLISKPNHILFKKVLDKFHYNIAHYKTFTINLNRPKSNCLELFGTKMFGIIVNDNLNIFNNINNILIPSKYYSKYFIFSFCNTTKKKYSSQHYKLYTKKHYSKIKEHLVIE